MTSVLVVGLGEVGIRAARQLIDTPGVSRVLVGARRLERAQEVAAALRDGAEPIAVTPGSIPGGITAVASAVPADADLAIARAAVEAGVGFASVADRDATLRELSALDGIARAARCRVIVGCGLAPGLSDVLARHAAGALDTLDELHVARWGVAGEASTAEARRAYREPALEWRDHAYVNDRRHSGELVWFPDPIAARECNLVATGVELLVEANPGVSRVTARLGVPVVHRFALPGRKDPSAPWGAVRVEAWGWQRGTRTTIVYGVIERTAVAAGTVLGVATAWLAGALDGVAEAPPGARSLGSVVKPVPFLAELSHRGVKAATFEGVGVA